MAHLRHSVAGAVIVALVATQAGCASSPPPSDEVTPAAADVDLIGPWVDSTSGQALPDGTNDSNGVLVLSTNAGSTTCGQDHVTVFLQIAWPAGTKLNWTDGDYQDAEAPRFVRDSKGSLLKTVGSSDLDVELPRAARATGFEREGNTIRVDTQRYGVYVTRPDGHTERWARLRPETGCA